MTADIIDITKQFEGVHGGDAPSMVHALHVLKLLEEAGIEHPVLYGSALRDAFINQAQRKPWNAPEHLEIATTSDLPDSLPEAAVSATSCQKKRKIFFRNMPLVTLSQIKGEEPNSVGTWADVFQRAVLASINAPLNAITMNSDRRVWANQNFIEHKENKL